MQDDVLRLVPARGGRFLFESGHRSRSLPFDVTALA